MCIIIHAFRCFVGQKKRKHRDGKKIQQSVKNEAITRRYNFLSWKRCLVVHQVKRTIWTAVDRERRDTDTIVRHDNFTTTRVYLCVTWMPPRRSVRTLKLCAVIGAKNSLSLIERDNRYKLNIAVKWQQVR